MAVFSVDSIESVGGWRYSRRAIRLALKLAGVLFSLGAMVLIGTWGYNVSLQSGGGVPEIRPSDRPFKKLPDDRGGLKTPFIGRKINKLIEGESNELPANRNYAYAPDTAGLRMLDLSPRDIQARNRILDGKKEVSIAGPEARELAADDEILELSAPVEQVWVVPKRGRLLIVSGEYAFLEESEPIEFEANRVAPSNVPNGSNLVQLGDFATEASAGREWRKVKTAFTDLLADKNWFIQESTSGGRPLFRLRLSGFDDRDAAEGFCSRLNARQANCIPTIMR